MMVRTVRLTDKGQLTVPADALRAMNARKGTEFLLIQEGERIVLVKASTVAKQVIDDFGGWGALAGPSFDELWSSKEDEAWDEA